MKPSTSPALGALLVCAVAFLLQGCPPAGVTEFANHTGQPITVRYADKVVAVPAGGSSRLHTFELPLAFEVATTQATWHYTSVYVGRDFMAPHFSFGLRIEPDGRIYAFQTADATTKISGQPQGYPLRPKA